MGDPAASMATAVEQYRTKYVFLAPTDYLESYVDIVMPDGAQVTIDGAPIGVSPTPIGSGYSIARVNLGPGNNGAHLLQSSLPVGIQVIDTFYVEKTTGGPLDEEAIASLLEALGDVVRSPIGP